MKKYFIDGIENLVVEVNLIGYKQEGESQVVIVRNDATGNIYFSCVIDCFELEKVNQTVNILQEEGVKSIDLLLWTHTDEDHSIGIDTIIDSFTDKKTEYFLPEFVSGSQKDMIEYNDRVSETFEKINSSNNHTNYNVHSVSVISGYTQPLRKISFVDRNSGFEIPFEIIAFAPISSLLRRRWDAGKKVKKNDFSIATIFTIGDIKLVFTGDIENQSIRQIPESLFEGISYLKTPHHTSLSSDLLVDYIAKYHSADKILSSTTTIFKNSNLPNTGLAKEYLKYSESLISTGSGEHEYGCIKTVFNAYDNLLIEEIIYGDCESL